MDAKFDTANGYLLNLKDGQQVVIDKLGNIGTDLNGVAKDATLTATKSTISSEAQSTRDALGTINTTIGQTKDAIGLGNQVNQEGHLATRTAVDQVKSVLASVYATIDGARTEANVSASAIQGKLDVGNAHLSGIKDNTAAINAQLNGFGNKLDTISGKVQTNTESTAQRLDEIIDLFCRINDLLCSGLAGWWG